MNKLGTIDTSAGVVSYEILGSTGNTSLNDFVSKMQSTFTYGKAFAYEGFTVAAFGDNNNDPEEMRNLIKLNPLLPEVLQKQVRFMFGQGPWLFKETIDDNGKLQRKPLSWDENPDVWRWLMSWKKNGLQNDALEYLKNCIKEYYYTEGIFSKWKFYMSRRTGGAMPVRGLEYIPSTRARLAMEGMLEITDRLEYKDITHVMVSYWDNLYGNAYQVYDIFDEANPLKSATTISYTKDAGFGEELYAYPTFYYGLKEWIKGSNLNPKYINSYLKNSLNAKIHVIIPDAWISQKEETLQSICRQNMELDQEGEAMITEYDGLTDIGAVYNPGLVNKLIDQKIQQLAKVMSGEGDNQGKFFVSRKFQTQYGVEEWEFKEIPVKYKEFITSILELDKHAMKMIVAGKGLPPSISNLTNEGLFGGSGSEAYYNYLIYLNQLTYAEDYITKDINTALDINFPKLRKQRLKLGFYRNIPQRQEELKPIERMDKISQS